ncbi:MAG: hypothetical protein U0165_10150 [Polyangiaceae bacterium]
MPNADCPAGTYAKIGSHECTAAGLPESWTSPDVSFGLVGVPLDGCGEGFEHDAEYGCTAILPEQSCPLGQMATPGETACHPVMDCGTGTWGNIPSDVLNASTTQFVWQGYGGNAGPSDGTQDRPWTTINQALSAASSQAAIAIGEGNYNENISIDSRPVKLWGRCPDKVLITGTPSGLATIDIYLQNNVEVHGVTTSGTASNAGISVADATGAMIDRVISRNNKARGILLQYEHKTTSATITQSLVEQNAIAGIGVRGGDATIEHTLVRTTAPQSDGIMGRGIDVYTSSNQTPGSLTLRSSVIEDNHESGVRLSGSSASVESSVLRGTLPRTDGTTGWGASMDQSTTGQTSTLSVKSSVFDSNTEVGLRLAGGQATIESTVVKNSLGSPADGRFGNGLYVDPGAFGAPTQVDVKGSLFEGNREIGVRMFDAKLSLVDTVVRRTQSTRAEPALLGFGILAESTTPASEGVLSISHCLVDENRTAGILIQGAHVSVASSIVRNTHEEESSQEYGAGILALDSPLGVVGDLSVESSLIEHNRYFGILARDIPATISSTAVRDTQEQLSDGYLGLGVASFQTNPIGGLSFAISDSELSDNTSNGLALDNINATIDRVWIARTKVEPSSQLFGRGIETHGLIGASTVTIQDSFIDRNPGLGIYSTGNILNVMGTTIHGEPFDSTDRTMGRGLEIDADEANPSSVTLEGVLVEESYSLGVSVMAGSATISASTIRNIHPSTDGDLGRIFSAGSDSGGVVTLQMKTSVLDTGNEGGLVLTHTNATVENTTIRNIVKRASDNGFGVGVVARETSQGALRNVVISNCDDAGVLALSGTFHVSGTLLECNALPLASNEAQAFKNDGNNVCGCGDTYGECTVKASKLSAPSPVAPLSRGRVPSGPIHFTIDP